MEDLVDDSLRPDANGVLDLQDKHWVTLDEIVWEFSDTLLELNVSRNQLVHLPAEVGNLVLLRELLVSHNRITAVPKQIANCIQLRKLELHHNRLKELPHEIQYCKRLEVLDVSFNELSAIPAELGRLQELRLLNVRHNKLTALPHTLCDCAKLTDIVCEDNDLADVPKSLRGNTNLVLWICGTVKRHRTEVAELVAINSDLERMARVGDEERLHLRQEIARLQREKDALLAERPYNYLLVKKHVLHVSSQVCSVM